MNDINTASLAADVLLRLLFYTTIQATIYAVLLGGVYLVCEKMLGRKR